MKIALKKNNSLSNFSLSFDLFFIPQAGKKKKKKQEEFSRHLLKL